MPRLWFWTGMLAAVAGLGNLSVWIIGLMSPPDTTSGTISWWLQLFLGVLLGTTAPYYFWRSRQDRTRIADSSDTSEG